MPDDFPVDEFTSFKKAAGNVLWRPRGAAWGEFAGASNLIGWRYRASWEDWQCYKQSWQTKGPAVDREENYQRERALFGMFTAGVSCIESTVYALGALASHPGVASFPFNPDKPRDYTVVELCKWLSQKPEAVTLVRALSTLDKDKDKTREWELWKSFRNRMTHRSNLPRVNSATLGDPLPPAMPINFGATSSTKLIEGGVEVFDDLHSWLARALTGLLVGGTELCPTDS